MQKDRAGGRLRVAMIALAVLAATAAVISYHAQFRMIFAFRHARVITLLQAAIPDVAALVLLPSESSSRCKVSAPSAPAS